MKYFYLGRYLDIPRTLPIKASKRPKIKLYSIKFEGIVIGKWIRGSNKYSLKELNRYKINNENPAPSIPWIMPSITSGKRIKLLVAPNRWSVSIVSCFE